VADDARTVVSTNDQQNTPATLLAVVISWRTTSASRSGRGRTFLGPMGIQSLQSDGTPAAGLISAVRTAAQTLVDAQGNVDGTSLGVLSVKQGLLRDFTGSTVHDKWAYLSSRRD
jgi:hypothetical protein